MKNSFLYLFFIVLFLNVGLPGAHSQEEVRGNGQNYTMHLVKKGETIFSICKAYQIEQKDLIAANPDLVSGLKSGTTLKIPAHSSAVKTQVQKIVREPVEFYYHKIKRKQTLAEVAGLYHVSEAELLKFNPETAVEMNVGSILKIPVYKQQATEESAERVEKENQAPTTIPLAGGPGKFLSHQVVSGETMFGIAKKYQVTQEELLSYNPSLSAGLKTGMVLRIPDTSAGFENTTPVLQDENHKTKRPEGVGKCAPDKNNRLTHYQVGLLLPLYLKENKRLNSGSLSEPGVSANENSGLADTLLIRKVRSIYPKSENFLQFYEGVLLAVDSLQQLGMNVTLHVFDSGEDLSTVNRLIANESLNDLDLIIGPVFPEMQKPVADFAAKNHIPFVSPLAATGNLENTNSWYFKVNPGKDYLLAQTANYVGSEFVGENFIVLKNGSYANSPEAKLVELCRSKLAGRNGLFHEYNLEAGGRSDLESLMRTDKTNVFVIPSESEAQVSVAVTTLNGLAEKYSVVLVGLSGYQRFKSIQVENYHKLNMQVLSPYYADYNSPLTNRVVSKYRASFFAEPSQFSFQGYDIAYYFLSALYNFGRDFSGCLPTYQLEQTQLAFHFRRTGEMGGFINQGLFVVNYTPDFDVAKLKVVGGE
jgi:LysM repeat protein/ABC-type branched-subunit amino acid transport system substrate-binding protein